MNDYDVKDIKTLEGIEDIRLRPDMTDISYEMEAGIDQLTTALVDQSQVECKAQIRLCMIIFENVDNYKKYTGRTGERGISG